jgi:hypothetical protein
LAAELLRLPQGQKSELYFAAEVMHSLCEVVSRRLHLRAFLPLKARVHAETLESVYPLMLRWLKCQGILLRSLKHCAHDAVATSRTPKNHVQEV